MADGDTQRRPIKLVDDLGPASPDNIVVKWLAHYGVPISETRSLRFMAKDQDIASKYKEYRVFLTGVRPNEKCPTTGKSFANEQGEIVINCWQIVIHWGENPCLEARWYVKQNDFLVASAPCPLAVLNPQVVKHLTGAFEVLLWVQERLSKVGRPEGIQFVTEDDKWAALELVIKIGRKLFRETGQLSQSAIARRMNGVYGISNRKSVYRLITKRCQKNWSRDIVPLIKQP